MDINAAGGSKIENWDAKIAALARWRESRLFSPDQQVALAVAEALTATPANVPDDLFAQARQHFSEAQLVELAATAAMENYRARFNRMFDVESQHFYHPREAAE